MRITGKVTERDLKEAGKLSRSKWYWPKTFLRNWYGLALICIVLWATIAGLIGFAKPNWKGLGVAWAIISAIVIWSVFRARTAMVQNVAQVNASLPDSITIASEGLRFDGPNGASGFQPWRNFKRWREGERVVIVDRSEGSGFFILPVADMSDVERQSLLGILRSNVDSGQ